LWFDEKDNWHPNIEDDLICLPFDSQEEATQMFNQAMELHNEELEKSQPTAKAS
jgi:hypothetical protein